MGRLRRRTTPSTTCSAAGRASTGSARRRSATFPALVISPNLKKKFTVDHTSYDTTSIIATIEREYALQPLGTRDAAVNDLTGDLVGNPGKHCGWFDWFCG